MGRAPGLTVTLAILAAPAVSEPGPSAFFDRFDPPSRHQWSVAHYAFSHPHFDTDWNWAQLEWRDGIRLNLGPKEGPGNRFDGASLRRRHRTGHGRYEVVLQAARGNGVVTGFFTYSGAYYGTRHDEIDIEFLGKNTRQMHVAWFVDGKLRNRFVELGFDAADRPRRYAFEWLPDRISWYAEGRLVHEALSKDGALPTVPGFVFVNIWAADPGIAEWSGIANPDTKVSAMVHSIRFTPLGDMGAAVTAPRVGPTGPQAAEARIASTEPAGPMSSE